jgi:hypothetical protein
VFSLVELRKTIILWSSIESDLRVVKERFGHAKISTTEGHLHTLPSADATALTALSKVWGGGARDGGAELEAARREIDELSEALAGLALRIHRSA